MSAPVLVRVAKPELRALLEAAYALTGRAWVQVDSRGLVRLTPKTAAARRGLVEALRAEYAAARERRRAARAARGARAEVLRRALALAAETGGRPKAPPARLSDERRAEISRLLAEAESAPKPDASIYVPWDRLPRRRA